MGTQEGGLLSFLTGAGTYREDAFERDMSASPRSTTTTATST